MRALRIGDPLHQGVTGFEEGAHYNYTMGGHTLILSVKNPLLSQINAVKEGEAVFGLMVREEAIFLLCRFGSLDWQVTHYNWWINPPVLRPDPRADAQCVQGRAVLAVALVNASDGIVHALRSVRLHEEFSHHLLSAVEAQTRPRFDPWRYMEVVEEVLHGSRTPAALLNEAMCVYTCARGYVPASRELIAAVAQTIH